MGNRKRIRHVFSPAILFPVDFREKTVEIIQSKQMRENYCCHKQQAQHNPPPITHKRWYRSSWTFLPYKFLWLSYVFRSRRFAATVPAGSCSPVHHPFAFAACIRYHVPSLMLEIPSSCNASVDYCRSSISRIIRSYSLLQNGLSLHIALRAAAFTSGLLSVFHTLKSSEHALPSLILLSSSAARARTSSLLS